MRYRELGNTGRQASMLGLGCEHLVGKPYEQVESVIHTALDVGINIFEVFMPQREIREHIAKALGTKRKDVLIQGHIGSTNESDQPEICRDLPVVQRYFEDLLRIFGGHIELGMMFFIDSEEDYRSMFESDILAYAQRLKAQGDIGQLGFSSHSPRMARRVVETGLVDLMLFSINPAFDLSPASATLDDLFAEDGKAFAGIDPERSALYRLCEEKGVGITVMKTLCAGKLLSMEYTPFARALTVPQCMHYALQRPAVTSVMVGCTAPEQILEAATYFDLPDEALDYTDILETPLKDFTGSCVYCNHCLPCPSQIDIAAVQKYLDIAKQSSEGVPASLRAHYASLGQGGADCIQCGACEGRCPFSVPVIDRMAEAAALFARP